MKGIKYYNFIGFSLSYGWHDSHMHDGFYYKAITVYKLFFHQLEEKDWIQLKFRGEYKWDELN